MNMLDPEHNPVGYEARILEGITSCLFAHRETARRLQEGLLAAFITAGQPMGGRNVIVYQPYGDDMVPTAHERIVLAPEYGHRVEEGIAELRVRFPLTMDDISVAAADEHSAAESQQTNQSADIFLEVEREGEDEGNVITRYLINSRGRQPYRTAADIRPVIDSGNDRFMVALTRPGEGVAGIPDEVPLIALDMVLNIHKYVLQLQGNAD